MMVFKGKILEILPGIIKNMVKNPDIDPYPLKKQIIIKRWKMKGKNIFKIFIEISWFSIGYNVKRTYFSR